MKGFWTTVLAVICVVVLVWGHSQWSKKTVVSGFEENPNNSTFTESKKEKGVEKSPTISDFTKNWPPESSIAFKKALKEKRQFKIVLAGSPALGTSPSGWAFIAKEGLTSTFGKANLNVEVKTYTTNTMEFTNNNLQQELIELGADMILFEPFLLSDNGAVRIEDSLEFIEMIMEDVKSANPETVFLLQPPNPIYSPKYYDTQVNSLREFADDNNISYLNHWEAWPDPSSEEIKNLLNQNTNFPNEQGHKVWADYILNYFISK